MIRLVGAVAALLGRAVRVVLLAMRPILFAAGWVSVIYSVSQFSPRVAWGVGGFALMLMATLQRPGDRRKA